jgi:DNA invertase Pin-like site-specific DNA recombinase
LRRRRGRVSRRRPAARRPTAPGRAVLDALGESDVLLVTRLGRLGRATRDLLDTLDAIAKAGAGFRSLADEWADPTTRTAD